MLYNIGTKEKRKPPSYGGGKRPVDIDLTNAAIELKGKENNMATEFTLPHIEITLACKKYIVFEYNNMDTNTIKVIADLMNRIQMSRATQALANSIEILRKRDREALIREISAEEKQACHICGKIQLVVSRDKMFKCKGCGFYNDKETNASRTIEIQPQVAYAMHLTMSLGWLLHGALNGIVRWHPVHFLILG